MTIRAYILIECDVATSASVSSGLRHLAVAYARVLSAETTSGPFDVIALLESADLERLGHAVTGGIQMISGVRRTVTCVVMETS